MTDVAVPDNAWDVDSIGAVLKWQYADGDHVEAGTIIAELTDEKVVVELDAPVSGRLSILVEAGENVREGQIIARIT